MRLVLSLSLVAATALGAQAADTTARRRPDATKVPLPLWLDPIVIVPRSRAASCGISDGPDGRLYACQYGTPQSDTAAIIALARGSRTDSVTVLRIEINADTAIAHVRSTSAGDQRYRLEIRRHQWTVISVVPSVR